MTTEEFIEIMNSGVVVKAGSPVHLKMHELSQEALKITAEINGSYHTPDELRALMEKLTGWQLDEHFGLFPPRRGLYQRRLQVSGSGRHLHRRRFTYRA